MIEKVARCLSLILLIGSCAPADGQTLMIQDLRFQTPAPDRFGRYPRGRQARIPLANGVTVVAPDGKDLLALTGDNNACLYGAGGSQEAYLRCMHNQGDIIEYSDGRIWLPYVSAPERIPQEFYRR